MSAESISAARAPKGIQLIDKDDRRRHLARLFEKITHSGRAHADEHFHKLGTRDREEWDIGFACDSARQKGFACTGRPDEQNPFGYPSAQAAISGRVLQEVDELTQLIFCSTDTRHVSKRHLGFFLHKHLGATLPD